MPSNVMVGQVNIRPLVLAPRYPIILCHGLFGFGKLGPDAFPWLQIHYWRGISKALRQIGCKVYEPEVPATGTVQDRAQVLHDYVFDLVRQGKVQVGEEIRVNLVAHSMGGLDCRYFATHLGGRVASLTSIGSPHRGTAFVDWYLELRQKTRLAAYLQVPAYTNLSTKFCRQEFNTPDIPQTKYYSYGARVRDISPLSPLHFPFKILQEREGDNDGLVSVKSAMWGTYLGTVDADHWGLCNRWFSSTRNFDAVDFYVNIAAFLHGEGF